MCFITCNELIIHVDISNQSKLLELFSHTFVYEYFQSLFCTCENSKFRFPHTRFATGKEGLGLVQGGIGYHCSLWQVIKLCWYSYWFTCKWNTIHCELILILYVHISWKLYEMNFRDVHVDTKHPITTDILVSQCITLVVQHIKVNHWFFGPGPALGCLMLYLGPGDFG